MLDTGDIDRVADRARDRAASSPPQAVGQKPMPSSPPVAATPRSCASERLRALSHVPHTPVCETTTGRLDMARASSIDGPDVCDRSRTIPRASIRRIISRPARVNPPFSMPCAEPPKALSKKWLGDIIRKPASATTSTLAGSSSSACAPSIARSPAVMLGSSRRRARYRSRSSLERISVNRPSDRRAMASARDAMCSARASRLRHVAGGQPRPGPTG